MATPARHGSLRLRRTAARLYTDSPVLRQGLSLPHDRRNSSTAARRQAYPTAVPSSEPSPPPPPPPNPLPRAPLCPPALNWHADPSSSAVGAGAETRAATATGAAATPPEQDQDVLGDFWTDLEAHLPVLAARSDLDPAPVSTPPSSLDEDFLRSAASVDADPSVAASGDSGFSLFAAAAEEADSSLFDFAPLEPRLGSNAARSQVLEAETGRAGPEAPVRSAATATSPGPEAEPLSEPTSAAPSQLELTADTQQPRTRLPEPQRRQRQRRRTVGAEPVRHLGLELLPPALVRPSDAVIDPTLAATVASPAWERVPVSEAAHELAPFRPHPLPPAESEAESQSDPHPLPQPHHLPLLSRTDWRLSSRARLKLHRSHPLPLWSLRETSTRTGGQNRLVGVGPSPARVGRFRKGEEAWGWKGKVPEGEKGTWKDADAYIERFQRLLDLSKASDEQLYLASLARAGSPLERQQKGLTVARAIGTWLTGTSRLAGSGAVARAAMSSEEREKERKRRGKGGAKPGATAVAEFRTGGGFEVTAEEGFKFESGTVLRISEAESAVLKEDSGPRPPAAAALETKWHVQGTLLEVRRDKLIVAFDELDVWPLGEDEAYQIDIGLDLGSYALQAEALDKLYYDPARQRERNAVETLAVQEAHVLDPAAKAHVREWTLQGTELREDLVPPAVSSLEDGPALAPETELGLFRENQLINSWVERYCRDDPLVLPGDPDLGLNASQTKAIAMALGDRLSLIQGPPGTGKSQTIVSLIALLKLHFRVPDPILLAAPTHVSVDHLVSLLVRAGLNPLRCGKASRVSPDVRSWTIERRQEEHPMWKPMEAARLASEEARQALQDFREEVRAGGTAEANSPATKKKDAELMEDFRRTWRTFIMREQKLYSSLLATADVFCATAVGSGSSKVLNMVDFPIVLLDEAAMCTEPVSLIPLMKGARHATLIGDHKQLPAVVTSKEARSERLHTSLFERLLQSGTVNATLLDTQYRMRPAISSFPNDSFYDGALHDASIVHDREAPLKSRFFSARKAAAVASPAFTSPLSAVPTGRRSESTLAASSASEPFPVSFVAHSGSETSHRQSLLNREESNLLISIAGDLLASNPDLAASDIGIISPYYAQTRLVSNAFTSGYAAARLGSSTSPLVLPPDRAASVAEVEVNTVDGFQGREKRVILLSTVRSNRGGRIGFLNDKRRLNVALTRARDALIVVGNEETLRRAASRAQPSLSSWFRQLWEDAGPEGPLPVAAAADPDADARIWADFLDWCQRHGVVKSAEAVLGSRT